MTVFATKEQASAVFRDLFEILVGDETFAGSLRASELTVQLVHSKPDFTLYLSADQVLIDEVPAPPSITIKMSCDTAHALWSGKLLLPLALAMGKLRVRGSIAKVLEFSPLLQPAFDRYPTLAAEAGLPV